MRNKIIQEAREWVGTPYQHQAMLKHVGVDCVGLAAGVGVAVGVIEISRREILSTWNYGRIPDPKRMGQLLSRYVIPVEKGDEKIGDIAWIQWRDGMPMHLAILSEYKGRQTIIHSTSDIGKVVEHSLSDIWRYRIVNYWRYPGLN